MSDTLYGSIEIRGAREHNLKSVSLDIPKRKITVFTGISGSGRLEHPAAAGVVPTSNSGLAAY